VDISLVRTRLAAAVESVVASSGETINCYGYVPDSVTPPVFYAGEVTINPNGTFGGDDIVDITCRVITGHSDDKEGQRLLDEFLRRTGNSSVRAALHAARGAPGQYALNGACDDFSVQAVQGYRLYRIGSEVFFGAEIIVRAIGDGSGD